MRSRLSGKPSAAQNRPLGVYDVMTPANTRDVIRMLLAGFSTATVYRFWLTAPVMEHLSQNQWRVVVVSVAAIVGSFWSLTKWKLSTLVAGAIVGLLAGGTWAALPISHGRVGNAFRANLESFGFDMSAFLVAAAFGCYCVSRLSNSYRYDFRGKDLHPNRG